MYFGGFLSTGLKEDLLSKKAPNRKIVECMKNNAFTIRKQIFTFGTNLIEAPKLKRTYSQLFNGPH